MKDAEVLKASAEQFGIEDPDEKEKFEEYRRLVSVHEKMVNRATALRKKLIFTEISPDLEKASELKNSEDLEGFAAEFNRAHPQGFAEDRYGMVCQIDGHVLGFDGNGKLKVFASMDELYLLMDADQSIRNVQRMPKIEETEGLMEGALTDEVVLQASRDLLRILGSSLGVKKPIQVLYGIGREFRRAYWVPMNNLYIAFYDAAGKRLGNLNWGYGDKGEEVMSAGQFDINNDLFLTGKGAGRHLVALKAEIGKALGYKAMEIRVDNRGFWAKIFSEASGLPFSETFQALGYGDQEGLRFDRWHYIKERHNWRYDFANN